MIVRENAFKWKNMEKQAKRERNLLLEKAEVVRSEAL